MSLTVPSHNPTKYEIYFQDGGTQFHRSVIDLHDYIQFYLLVVILIVSWLMLTILINYYSGPSQYTRFKGLPLRDFSHGPVLEVIWTLVPAIILVIIGIPSYQLLSEFNDDTRNLLTIKCIGAQWYWTYEITNSYDQQLIPISYDSYMIPTDSLNPGDFRLMEVDIPLVVPYDTYIRLIVTSKDVIHSWSVPSLGIKVDAVPGRLNQTTLNINHIATYYGACQEICGIQHAFMPINVKAVTWDQFYLN